MAKEKHYFNMPFKSKAKSDGEDKFLGYIEGFASTNHKDRHEEIISKEALRNGAKTLGDVGVVLKNHKSSEDPIGTIISSKYMESGEDAGIHVRIGISKTAATTWTLIEEGAYKSFSIGFFLEWDDYEWVEEDNGDTYGLIKDMEVVEVSVVNIPANPAASFGRTLSKAYKSKSHDREVRKMTKESKPTEEKEAKPDPVMDRLDSLSKSVETLAGAMGKFVEFQSQPKQPEPEPKAMAPERKTPMSDNKHEEHRFDSREELLEHHKALFAKMLHKRNAYIVLEA